MKGVASIVTLIQQIEKTWAILMIRGWTACSTSNPSSKFSLLLDYSLSFLYVFFFVIILFPSFIALLSETLLRLYHCVILIDSNSPSLIRNNSNRSQGDPFRKHVYKKLRILCPPKYFNTVVHSSVITQLSCSPSFITDDTY